MTKKVTHVWRDAMHAVERKTVKDATFEDIKGAMDEINASWPTPQKILPKIKAGAADVVVKEGFPDPGISVNHKGRFWCEHVGKTLPRGCTFAPGWAYIQKHTDPLTPCHEAAQLYFNALEVEWAIESGDVEKVFAQTLRLGWAVNRFRERTLHLKTVTRGAKVAGGQMNAAHATNVRHKPLRDARFERMAELVPMMGVDSAAAQCEVEGLGGWTAIKRQWNRHQKKRDS
ncbi:hypothetical protein [Pontitalea aquivivens]|uniref:hypothetical protein n=1 Tax=Pontitalea aquivivens TaxID=3388663 RepID=UPI0039711145